MRITNQQKKQLSDVFKNSGLKLSDFDVNNGDELFVLQYKFDYFSYKLQKNKRNWQVKLRPINQKEELSYEFQWERVLQIFKSWCDKLKIELETDTGWEQLENKNFDSNFEDDKQLNKVELENIKETLKQIKFKINFLGLDKSIQEDVIKNIDYIENKTDDSITKKEWKLLFYGVLFEMLLSNLLTQDNISNIINWFLESMSNIFLITNN